MDILTLDDFDLKGKTVLLRVDLNVPIDHDTKEILGEYRIEEAAITIKALNIKMQKTGMQRLIVLQKQ